MGSIGVWELIIIAILVMVIFGGKRLPELGRGLGKGLANFRQAVREPEPTQAETAAPAPMDDDGSSPAEPPRTEIEGGRH